MNNHTTLQHENTQLRQQVAELEATTNSLRDQLHTLEQQFQVIQEAAQLGVWQWNIQEQQIVWSASLEALLGLDPGTFDGSFDMFMNQVHPEDRAAMQQVIEHVLATGAPFKLEHRLLHKDGSIRWISSRGMLYRDAAGQPVRLIGTAQDITERRQLEDKLRVFYTLSENAPDCISVATMDGVFTYLNPAFRAQYRIDESTGSVRISDITAPESMEQVQTRLIPQLLEQGIWAGEVIYRRTDGSTFPGEISVFVLKDNQDQPQAFVAIVRDITQRKQAEAERATLQQQVIDAQQAALRELSTPLIPVSDHVVIMPLIGSIDSKRAYMVLETLLEGVAQHQARLAILDITGVSVVDTQVAQALVRAAQAVKLLGAQIVLTGIQPQIAQTLVHLGIDLNSMVTLGSLQAGIAYALNQPE